MRRKIFLVRETLSGNWRRLLHFPVLPGAPQIEWMPAKNGNRKGGEVEEREKGGLKGEAEGKEKREGKGKEKEKGEGKGEG